MAPLPAAMPAAAADARATRRSRSVPLGDVKAKRRSASVSASARAVAAPAGAADAVAPPRSAPVSASSRAVAAPAGAPAAVAPAVNALEADTGGYTSFGLAGTQAAGASADSGGNTSFGLAGTQAAGASADSGGYTSFGLAGRQAAGPAVATGASARAQGVARSGAADHVSGAGTLFVVVALAAAAAALAGAMHEGAHFINDDDAPVHVCHCGAAAEGSTARASRNGADVFRPTASAGCI
jgi:hypothetical protein